MPSLCLCMAFENAYANSNPRLVTLMSRDHMSSSGGLIWPFGLPVGWSYQQQQFPLARAHREGRVLRGICTEQAGVLVAWTHQACSVGLVEIGFQGRMSGQDKLQDIHEFVTVPVTCTIPARLDDCLFRIENGAARQVVIHVSTVATVYS